MMILIQHTAKKEGRKEIMVLSQHRAKKEGRKEMFYLTILSSHFIYDVGHMAKGNSESKRGIPLPPLHGLFSINSK